MAAARAPSTDISAVDYSDGTGGAVRGTCAVLFQSFDPAFRQTENAVVATLVRKIVLQFASGPQPLATVSALDLGRFGSVDGNAEANGAATGHSSL